MTDYRSTGTGDRLGAAVAPRRPIMGILVALGVSALVGLLGFALILGPAFLD